ncbi:MAG TPA: hypothetical protein VGL70_09215 [Candidatus Binatia bacterium]|jgi:hypothetical protein
MLDYLCVLRLLITAAVVSFSIDAVSAGEMPDALTKKLAEFKGAERGQMTPVKSEALSREFRGYSFYVLRFRQYPVAVAPPDPLKANNLFMVKPDGSVENIVDTEKLKNFFRAALAPVKAEAEARDTAAAWLQLAQELYQDGFFRFSLSEDSIQVGALKDGGLEVSGKAVVNPQGGNSGQINVALTFDPAGALTKVSESAQLRRGVRPICQATKLLDPDPIVRGMAEQAILLMGSAAKEYLDEQRAKAGPELQYAIDEIWRRIVAKGR